jgi:hypothetical protein
MKQATDRNSRNNRASEPQKCSGLALGVDGGMGARLSVSMQGLTLPGCIIAACAKAIQTRHGLTAATYGF